MARCFAKVSEEEIKEAFFYPSDLVNTKTTIPLRVGEERWIYTSTLRVLVYIHHYSPPLRGIVVYYLFGMKISCLSTCLMPTFRVSFRHSFLRNSPFVYLSSKSIQHLVKRSSKDCLLFDFDPRKHGLSNLRSVHIFS